MTKQLGTVRAAPSDSPASHTRLTAATVQLHTHRAWLCCYVNGPHPESVHTHAHQRENLALFHLCHFRLGGSFTEENFEVLQQLLDQPKDDLGGPKRPARAGPRESFDSTQNGSSSLRSSRAFMAFPSSALLFIKGPCYISQKQDFYGLYPFRLSLDQGVVRVNLD